MPALSNITPADSSDGAVAPATVSDAHLIPLGTSLGRYIVVKHVGTGGQGVVYAAYDPALERSVALKLLRTDVGKGDADHRRTQLLREAQEQVRLQHPNVVGILHVGTFLDQLYLAMPFMAKTLGEYLATKPPAAQVLARFVEAGRGLAAAHAQGMVHRDFKPDNVMLDERGVAQVSDFGLAQRGGGTGRSGTARYLSPEQHSGTESVGPASDQFSFCVALCEALTGQVPSAGTDKLPASLPQWLRPVLLRGLAVKPGDRYPSMDVLLEALVEGPEARKRFLSQLSVGLLVTLSAVTIGWLATRESATERAQRECLSQVDTTEAEMWSPERVAQMEQRFVSVAGAGGLDIFGRVKALMGPEVKAWAKATGLACVKPVSTAHARCLESRGRVLQSFSELFQSAESKVVAAALSAVHLEVLPVAGCLTSSVAAPRVVPDSEADQRLRPTLASARVLRVAGQYDAAILAAMAVVEQAHALGAVRVEAEAQLVAGQLYSEQRRPEAKSVLMRAVFLAEQASADEERARAWMLLITWYASHGEFEAAAHAKEQADAIVERLGRPDHLEAQLQNQLAQLLKLQGDRPAAERAFKLALDLRHKQYDDSHPLVTRAKTNYANTLPADQARPLLEQVLATRAQSFGEQHPETANAAHNLGLVVQELDPRKALEPLRRALKIWEGQTPPDLCRLAREHFTITSALEGIRPQTAEEVQLAYADQLAGLGRILQVDCSGTISMERELETLLRLAGSVGRPEVEVRRIKDFIELVKKKETLPQAF